MREFGCAILLANDALGKFHPHLSGIRTATSSAMVEPVRLKIKINFFFKIQIQIQILKKIIQI